MAELLEDRYAFGLTGGMGSGKSTVSNTFRDLGVVIADADQIVHDLQAPGMPLLQEMQTILGSDIVSEDGSLNRPRAAERIFADDAKRLAVNGLIHPLVWGEINTIVRGAQPDDLVVLDVPLLLEYKPEGLLGVMVVDTPVHKAIGRLVLYRGFTEEEARNRISTQMSREERLSHADFVIHNQANRSYLRQEIQRAYAWMDGFRSRNADSKTS